MKIQSRRAVCAVLCLLATFARAADSDLSISCEKKRLEMKHVADRPGIAKKSEQWGYTVSFENRTFKPLANLEVKYIVFYKHAELGVKGAPRKLTKGGTQSIAALNAFAKTSFDTVAVTLTKSTLVGPSGGYSYFTNGAKPTAADTLAGMWIRVYQNGSLFAEYAYPAELKSSETWQDPKPQ